MTANKTPMGKAFTTVRGAIKRGDITELKCKLIWLNSVIGKLLNTVFANEAQIEIAAVTTKINQLS